MKIDNNNDLIIVGFFAMTSDFDPGSGVVSLTPTSGYEDIFILKLNSQGNFIFVKGIGGSSSDVAQFVTTDGANNIYVTGQFKGSVDFDPSASTLNLGGGNGSVFVLKLNASGDLVWAKNFVNQNSTPDLLGGYHDIGVSICVDSQGRVHIAGEFYGTVDFDPGVGSFPLTFQVINGLSPSKNIFYAALDENGLFISAHSIKGYRPFMTKDPLDNLYLQGTFLDQLVDFDPGTGTSNLSTTGAGQSFLRKMDSNGNFLWVRNMGFIAPGWLNYVHTLTCDIDNNVYVSSGFRGSFDSDPSANVNTVNNVGINNNINSFITKLFPNGDFAWTVSYGSANSNNVLKSFVIDNSNAIISVGELADGQDCDFDPSASFYDLTGGMNFMQKLGQCIPTSSSITPVSCGDYTAPDGQVYTQSGSYTAVIPNVAGCDSTISISLTIPTFDVTVSQTGAILTANASGQQYQWIDCATDQNINGATSQSYTATSNGQYAVIVGNGTCGDTSTCLTVSGLGFEDLSITFEVYPNPAQSSLYVKTAVASPGDVRIIDLNGRVLIEQKVYDLLTTIDISSLSPGSYFVQIGENIPIQFQKK
jgi:hypothetical protein